MKIEASILCFGMLLISWGLREIADAIRKR
jgi:hypothetical protein